MEDEIEEGAPQLPPTRVHHIKKRALKNKALSISFDEKHLREYVTGFHKRKKMRRKEAQKKQEEALRRKRIEDRKKRKLEREIALYGGVLPTGSASDGNEEHNEDDEEHGMDEKHDIEEEHDVDEEESNPIPSISATTMYDNGDVKVTVTTSEISREDGEEPGEKTQAAVPRSGGADMNHNLAVNKKKSFKKASKNKFHRKLRHVKRDKKKGNKKNKKH